MHDLHDYLENEDEIRSDFPGRVMPEVIANGEDLQWIEQRLMYAEEVSRDLYDILLHYGWDIFSDALERALRDEHPGLINTTLDGVNDETP